MAHFRPAVTSEAKPLIGLYAESGCGKTTSALLLAKGFAGDMSKVGMIETEAGRGEAYADDPHIGGYMVRPIRGAFSPTEYGKAISEAEAANLRVLIIDSASHEWEGAGGVLSMAADNQAAGKKGPIVWQQPKMQHQREFMLRLMQTPIPLVIVCMRAKYPMMEKAKAGGGKEWVRSEELEPKQSEDILYEMFVHGWIDKQHNFHGTKYTLNALRQVLEDGKPISVESGKRLAAWAAGTTTGTKAQPGGDRSAVDQGGSSPSSPPAASPIFISVDQATHLTDQCHEIGVTKEALCRAAKVNSVDQIEAHRYQATLAWIERRREALADRAAP